MVEDKKIEELLNFGIINLDKPSGPTSFSVSDFVRKKLRNFGVRKTSHFGTLDPKVTGVLPVALGRACRLTGYFLGHDKVYVGVMNVHEEIEMDELQKIIDKNFVGKIVQLPPVKSRVKRAERVREVKQFKLLEKDGKDFLFLADVEGGTYIRKLCSDLGELVGGAHMLELRRTRAGIFEEIKSVKVHDFEKAVDEFEKGNGEMLREMILPGEEAIKKVLPMVEVRGAAIEKLLTGKVILKKDLLDKKKLPKEGSFAVFSGKKFIEIASRISSDDAVGKAEFVFN